MTLLASLNLWRPPRHSSLTSTAWLRPSKRSTRPQVHARWTPRWFARGSRRRRPVRHQLAQRLLQGLRRHYTRRADGRDQGHVRHGWRGRAPVIERHRGRTRRVEAVEGRRRRGRLQRAVRSRPHAHREQTGHVERAGVDEALKTPCSERDRARRRTRSLPLTVAIVRVSDGHFREGRSRRQGSPQRPPTVPSSLAVARRSGRALRSRTAQRAPQVACRSARV